MVASRDEWFSPIQMRVGPDGALWIIDWYNLIIQHNPTPPGFELGTGNAYENELRDKQHSRIYRIVYDEAPDSQPINLVDATPAKLIATLSADNLFWRSMAQRKLVERGKTDILNDLYALVEDVHTDATGLNAGAIHALWTLHGLGALDGSNTKALAVATQALHHPSAGVQRAAIMTLPRTHNLLDAMLQAGMLPDPAVPEGMSYTVGIGQMDTADPHLRLAALLAVADMPYTEHAGNAVADLISVPDNMNDEGIRTAAMAAGIQHGTAFLSRAMKIDTASDTTYAKHMKAVLETVASRVGASGIQGGLGALLDTLENSDAQMANIVLEHLIKEEHANMHLSAADAARLSTLVTRLKPDATATVHTLLARLEAGE